MIKTDYGAIHFIGPHYSNITRAQEAWRRLTCFVCPVHYFT